MTGHDACLQRFCFSGTLIRRQCLPVGHDERLAFFITGTQGCLPKLMTVVVEPTASITENSTISQLVWLHVLYHINCAYTIEPCPPGQHKCDTCKQHRPK